MEPATGQWPNRHLSRFIDCAGIRWHVQQAGDGPVLLLVHGTGASTHSWRDLIPILTRSHAVLAVDLPGHGMTEPARGASIDDMSRNLGALLRELGVEPAYGVGHSAGAVILCRMALDGRIAPTVIVGLNGAFVPLGGTAGVLYPPIARWLARSSTLPRFLARRAADPASVARLIDGTGSRLDAAGLAHYARLLRDPRHVAGALAMMGDWDLRGFWRELPRLATPLVLIAAKNDRTVPAAQAHEVARRVPHATVRELPGLGHLAHEEEPARVAAEVLSVCAAHARRSGSDAVATATRQTEPSQ